MIAAWVVLVLGFLAPFGAAFGYACWVNRGEGGAHRAECAPRTPGYARPSTVLMLPASGHRRSA